MPLVPMTDQGGPVVPREIASAVQGLSPTSGALVELYELDTTAVGGGIYYFHDGLNGRKLPIVWQGHTYTAVPIMASGFDTMGDGAPGRPRLLISNVDQVVGSLMRTLQDFEGAKIIRHRTFEKFLDAVNFEGGNPNANPAIEFPLDVYWIDRKVTENKLQIEFELAAPIDLQGVRLPRRQIIANICPVVFKSAACGYTGGLTTCDKGLNTLNGCKVHFGADAELPFGGFPSAGRVRS